MKKIFLLSLMAIVCQMMQAQEKVLVDSIYYTINNGEATVCGYVPDANGEFRMNIPESIKIEKNTYYVTGVIDRLHVNQTGIITVLTIPNTVKRIGRHSFRNTLHVDELVIPESVDTIGMEAFDWASIKKVSILGNPVHDGNYCYIPTGPGMYGGEIFSRCTLEELYAPKLEVIGSGMFYQCEQLKYVYAPNLRKIAKNGFAACYNLIFDIPESIECIEVAAFYNACKNSGKISLPNPLPACLCEGSFASFKGEIPLVHLTSSQPDIPANAFSNCFYLKAIELDEGIRTIGGTAFMNNKLVDVVILPSTLESIGSMAFYGCVNLKNVYCLAKSTCKLVNSEFGSFSLPKSLIPSDAKLYVPVGCTEAYKAAGWGEYFSEIIEMDEANQRSAFAKSVTGVTSIIAPSKTNAGYFNLQGQKLDAPQKGINILRTDDGKARKVYVK